MRRESYYTLFLPFQVDKFDSNRKKAWWYQNSILEKFDSQVYDPKKQIYFIGMKKVKSMFLLDEARKWK